MWHSILGLVFIIVTQATASTFAARIERVRQLDRRISQVRGPELAELEFSRLKALNDSIKDIATYEPKDPAERAWLAEHEMEVDYSEPAGQWILRSDLFWQLEAKHRGQPVAEEIAWAAAQNGLPGECEGYIPCHLEISLLSESRYLDLYPTGPHADEGLDQLDFLLGEILKPKTPYTIEAGDRPQFEQQVAKLTAIVQKTNRPQKAQVLERLRALPKAVLK